MFSKRIRWTAVLTVVLLTATSVLADGTDPLTTEPSWWVWLLSRIGVPGG
jgi:hypothetical protein